MEIIAAFTENRVIGVDGVIPWHLPTDLVHFKKLTLGHVVVMGRRTWESIGKPLRNRINIVITRKKDYQASGATVVHSFEDAIKAAQGKRVFVIGGGEIYTMALPLATRLHLTRIHTELDGDTYFPVIKKDQWVSKATRKCAADKDNPFSLTFQTLVRA